MRLTAREALIVKLRSESWSDAEIAAFLGRSVKTVEHHRKRAADKMGWQSLAALTIGAIQMGLTKL